MAVYLLVAGLHRRISKIIKRVDVLLPPHSLKILDFFEKELKSFRNFVERLDSKSRERMSASLQGIFYTIKAYIYEDGLIFANMNSILDGERYEDVSRGIHSLVEQLKKVEKEYYTLQEDDQKEVVSSSSSRAVSKTKMVGLCDLRRLLKDDLIHPWRGDSIFNSIFGMAGIGKTTLAREIFEDLDIIEWFECRVWVTAGFEWRPGRERTSEEITEDILAQVDPEAHKMVMGRSEEEKGEALKESLKGKRYLILLDDVWNESVGEYLKSSFPDDRNGSHVVLTTRLSFIDMRLLNKEESWDLLRLKVFVGVSCPPRLVDTGKKIAEKCDGLPLTIVTIADLLSKVPESLWIEVATKRKHKLFVEAYDQISQLSLSGMGYPWEEMSKIASLPNLEVLKLRFNAFRGPEWEVEDNGFPNLQALLIEDIDLVKLKWAHGSFKSLTALRIKHCYKLKELHLGNLPKITELEIVDCNPLTEWYVKNNALKYNVEHLLVRSSWKL